MGKRIVITSFGSFGDVYPYIGLALGLRARGHDPVLAMPAFYREMVEREGLGFRPVRPDVDPTDRETVARIMDARTGTEFIIQDLILASLRDTFADLREVARGADLLVTHPVTFAGPVVAQHLGMTWASTVLAPMSFFSPHDLPVFPPMPWAKRLEAIPGAASTLVGLARPSLGSGANPSTPCAGSWDYRAAEIPSSKGSIPPTWCWASSRACSRRLSPTGRQT